MRQADALTLVAGARRKDLPDGTTLRLLTALEILEAGREAETLTTSSREAALCSNACLLARALEKRGTPLFSSGEAILSALSVSDIARLSACWADFEQSENPGLSTQAAQLDRLKKVWSTRPLSAFAGVCSAHLARFRQRSV